MKYMIHRVLVVGLILVGAAALRAGESLLTMLDPYFRIQSALSDDKMDGVKADASAIAQSAKGLGSGGEAIAKAAESLAAATDLAAARTAFGQLSDAVIAYSESTKTDTGAGVNAMFCPMVNKQWLQKGDKVSNPYYGKSMLTCGEKKKKAAA